MLRRLVLILVLVLVYQPASRAAAFALSQRVDQRMTGADAVAIADFNGDGRDDIAAIVQDALEVYLQKNDGSLAPAIRVGIWGVKFHTVHASDLGADGTTEILAGNEKGLAVYKWNGTSAFVLDDRRASSGCLNIATADLDGDGAPDVVCLGLYADAMLLYSDPTLILSAPVYMQTGATGAGEGQAVLKDVTGDGKPDLLLASGSANSFFVYPHDGDRGFLPAVAYPYPEEAFWSRTIEALDLDNDDDNEVVVSAPCNMPCARLFTYRRGAGGYLELWQTIPTLDSPSAFLATDLDGDGYEDLLVGHRGWSTVGRYMGRGKGLPFTELWSSVPVQGHSRTLAVGDLNHDGAKDVAVANSFGASLLYGGRQATSDFDNDLVSDLLWRNAAGEVVFWESADSTKLQSIYPRDTSWSIQAIGDFDGDGVADIFWRNGVTGINEIQSTGARPTSVPNQDLQVVGSGDFDGDGRADLLWRNKVNGVNGIWKSGDPATPQPTATMSDLRWKVAGIGDFDGDRQSDILWRHSTTGSNVIWRSGRLETPQTATAVTDLRWTVAGVGDFNGDGKDDVVWRHTGTGANGIWLSANSATQLVVTSVTNLAWTIAAVGDYNGDERADLMWRNSNGSNVIWRSADSRQTQPVTAVTDWSIVR